MQSLDIQDGLGGVASLEEGAASTPDPVHRAREISQEVASPVGELCRLVAHQEVKMIGHHTDRIDRDVRESLLRSR